MSLPAVILAGGRATRLGGGDKALTGLGGQPMLARGIARLAPQAGPLALNANGEAARFAGFALPVIADSVAGHPGPLAGVLAGLDWAAGLGAEGLVSVAADTPFFPADLVARLAAAGPFALAASDDGLHPTFGLWPVAARDALRDALAAGERRVGRWAEAAGAVRAAFEDKAAFFNVNTPGDLAEARRRVEEER